MRAKESLLALTNEFLEKFFIESHRLEKEWHKGNNNVQTLEEHKSYAFAYSFVDCLAECDYVVKEKHFGEDINPLIEMGFVDNIAKKIFNLKIQGSVANVEFMIANLHNQTEYEDIKIVASAVIKEIIVDNLHINPNHEFKTDKSGGPLDEKEPLFITKQKEKITKKFIISNNRSGRENYLSVEYIDGEFEKYDLFDKDDTKYPILSVDLKLKQLTDTHLNNLDFKINEITYIEESNIVHYKHIANINSFYTNMYSIIYMMQENIKESK